MDSLRLFHRSVSYGESTRIMDVLTQFKSCALDPDELNRVLAMYVALEQLRVFRRLLVKRFGALSAVALVIGVALHWISPAATACSVALFLVPPIWAWIAELRLDKALDCQVERIPGITRSTDSATRTSRQSAGAAAERKVVKSS